MNLTSIDSRPFMMAFFVRNGGDDGALYEPRRAAYAVIRERIGAGDFSLPDLGRPCSHGRSYRTAARRDGRPRAQAEGDTRGVVGMTRARPNSGQAAKRPVAATPDASLPLDASVLSIVANLEGLDLNGLRRQWRAHLGSEAAAHLPRWLLIRVLAYRLQSDAFADLDQSIRRILRSGKEMASALLSTGARLKRARAWV